jgi:hydroxypyruvate reductase
MNTVRQQLSQLKGGGLAGAIGEARLLTLLISDIPGDALEAIASGPTIASKRSGQDALDILDRYDIAIPMALREKLKRQLPKSVNSERHSNVLIASPAIALKRAAEEARRLGFNTIVLGDAIECESAELGKAMAGIAQGAATMSQPVRTPAAIISGGETTVTIGSNGAGRGGRNTEFALSMAIALDGQEHIYALAGDSDGIDGTEDAAGAYITPHTLERAKAKGLDPNAFLTRHDSYSLFQDVDALVKTGPTLTNVNDIRIVLVY